MTVYTTRDVVYHTPGAYHPGDELFKILKQSPGLSPGRYVVYHPPCGMPHDRYGTPKISAPPTNRAGTATTFLPVVCGQFQSCTSVQTNTTPNPNLKPYGGSRSAGSVVRLLSVLAVWQSFVNIVITLPRVCHLARQRVLSNAKRPLNLSPGDNTYITPLKYTKPGDVFYWSPKCYHRGCDTIHTGMRYMIPFRPTNSAAKTNNIC